MNFSALILETKNKTVWV